MKQALHIFKKDARYLRWELAVSLVFMAVFVYVEVERGILGDFRSTILPYLLLPFWAFLCARLIQAEPIPGDRQFWVTRPYEWRSLLGAKLLFVVVFIAIPLVVADAVILGIKGFSIAAHMAGLLWSLILIVASVLTVFCAFATLTRGLTEWMLGAIVTVGALYTLGATGPENVWGGVQWMREYTCVAILLAAASVVLLGQYRRRRTVSFALVLGAGLVGSSVYANYTRPAAAFELETRFSRPKIDPSPIRIAALPVERSIPRPLGRGDVFLLAIPVDVSGLGEGQDLISDEVIVSIKNENGKTWRREGSVANNHLEHTLDGYRLTLRVDRPVLEKRQAVDLTLTLYLTTLGNPVSTAVQVGGAPKDVPGMGRCRDVLWGENQDNFIVCESALRVPGKVLLVNSGPDRDRLYYATSYSPFPADADSSILPIGRYYHSGSRRLSPDTLTTLEPLAHFRRDLHLPGVYLADYQVASRF